MRAAAQSISYELSLNTVIFCVLLAIGRLEFNEMQIKGPFCLIALLEVFIIWVIRALAELNRIPFDFAEGESELVSGYIVEYGGILFVFVILSEYGRVIFTRVLTVVFFFIVLPVSGVPGNSVFVLVAVLISLVIIVLRGALPRYRYDKLIEFC
jgi:NADH:ubiquinone oxidoreductase subunit H